jgi:hypothetical protein
MGVSRRKVKKVGPAKEKVTKREIPSPDVLVREHLRSPTFKLSDRQAESLQIAERFGLERDEIRAAVRTVNTSKEPVVEVKVSLTKKRTEMQDVLSEMYDRKAREWSFESMADMLTTAHTEIVAIAIRKPETFGKECIATLKEVSKVMFPIEKATKTVKRRIPAGDSREIVLQRIEDRLEEKRIEPKEENNGN